MLGQLLKFERRLILGNGLFWIVALIFGALGFAMMASDNVSIGGAVGNVLRNAPVVVVAILAQMSVFSMLLATIFVGGAALRDFELRTAELFFVTPMKRRDYLLGRFGGGFAAALAILAFTAFGLWLGTLMPWLDATRLGPTPLRAYAWAFALVVIPNLLFVCALLFALATLTRSMLATYIGVIAFFVLWTVAGSLTADLDSRWIGALVDPSGSAAIAESTRYWSADQMNSHLPPLGRWFLLNRALWLGAAGALLFAAFRLFRADREGLVLRRRRAVEALAPSPRANASVALPAVTLRGGAGARLRQLAHQTWFDFKGLVGGAPFLVMLALGLLLLFTTLKFSALIFGTAVYPVTGNMLTDIAGAMRLFMIIILTFGAGELVWRERSMGVAEATDAYATPNWLPLASKLAALIGVVAVLYLAGIVFAVLYQLAHGYTQIEPALYAKGFALEILGFALTAALALFLQVLSGNKFLGYLLMIGYLVLRVSLTMNQYTHPLYLYGAASRTPWSDMNGYGHFLAPYLWMRAYWGAFATGLVVLAALFWPRGTLLTWKERVAVARQRFRGPAKAVLALAALAFVGLGAWIFVNTNVWNHYYAGDTLKQRAADYEKQYRQYKDVAQPRITTLRADVDIYPEQRRAVLRGHYVLQNKHDAPISELHVRIEPELAVKRLDFAAHSVAKEDKDFGYTIYKLAQPLAPGATMDFDFELEAAPHGFPADGGDTAIVENGTFFNNGVLPHFGYDENAQLSDRNDRRKYGLPELPRMHPITDEAARADSYLGRDADWIDFETTVSTSADQIALAPGYLQREWTENGRHYFHYKGDTRILAFVSWLSARWQVKRDTWHDVAIEVYYDAHHPYNVDRMIEAAKKSLDYYTQHFSPYQFHQVRILEFPGYARFAQSFANTIPYSEAIGFIADLRDTDAIDYVFYVTAHEVAHQWWAHQVIGANVQGATMLSESLAQYSALMVMEHEYGAAKMRKFLKYELDTYLRMRATERVAEQPLALNENQQYIHYNKGSVVFYALKDYIGEDTLDAILATFIKQKAFQEPPFTTSKEFLALLREKTDPKYAGLITDLFERIVFFDHRTLEARAHKRADGKYDVTLKVHVGKSVADAKGKETEEPVDEWVDVGVFARAPGAKESDEKVLYLQKHHFTQGDSELTVTVDAEPYDAGIDPLNKLVDRDSNDNRRRITLQ